MTDTVNHVGGALVTGLTATGTNQATALQLANRAGLNEVTTVASSTGVVLPTPKFLGLTISIVNQGLNALSVYPQVGGTLDNGTANAAVNLAAGKTSTYQASSLTNWYTVAVTSTGSGSVTSVTFTGDGTVLSSTPSSAVTTSGTITASLALQSANEVLAGPTTGSAAAPTFRALLYTDLPTMPSHGILANTTSGPAAPAGVTLSALLDAVAGSSQGDVLYRGASAWSTLAPGTIGQYLATGGSAANPSWGTPVSSGSGISGLIGDVTTAAGSLGSTAAFLAGQSNIISSAISAAQNNWSPTGWLTAGAMTANLIRVTPTAIRVSLTGLAAPAVGTIDGATVTIENAVGSGFPLRFYANSASSSAGNKFGFLSDVFLSPGESVVLQYDNASTIWRELNPHKDHQSDRWGSANDGTATISSSSTLSRTWYYDNLTLSTGAALTLTGWDIYVNDTLDISGAPAGSIVFNGNNGTGGANGGGGGAGGPATIGTNSPSYQQFAGGSGGAGATGAGGAGAGSATKLLYNSAAVGASGAGGTGGSGAAGASAGNSTSPVQPTLEFRPSLSTGANGVISAGMGGSGGGGGGGDGSASGGGGGGGGASGGGIRIFARNIYRGTNSTAAIIQAKGGNGALGGSGIGGATGGGGGGSGGNGGTVMVFYGNLYGSTITDAIDVSGGNGGNGGTFIGGGANGSGAMAGPGGYAMTFNATTGAATTYTGNSRVAGSGITGGTATSSQTSL